MAEVAILVEWAAVTSAEWVMLTLAEWVALALPGVVGMEATSQAGVFGPAWHGGPRHYAWNGGHNAWHGNMHGHDHNHFVHDHHFHDHFHNNVFIAGIGWWPGYYGYGYGYGGCGWLYRQAVYSGSSYWWNRYYACTGYY